MPENGTFFQKLTSISFVVKNNSQNRRIKIFNYPINPGGTRDLLAIPEISEADIRHSLIKGELANFLRKNVISIVSSSIDLTQYDPQQATFINNSGGAVANGPNPATWTQADWYIDWVNGSDDNDGKTIATAVKTVMGGVVARWGTSSPMLKQHTTLHILTSQPLGAEYIFLTPNMGGMYRFTIVGTLQAKGSPFALGTVTAKNRTTNTQLSATGLTTTTAGQLLVNITRGSSRALIHDPVTGKLSQPLPEFVVGSPVFGLPAENDTWTTGDSVQLYNFPTINLTVLRVSGSAINANTDATATWLQRLHIVDASGQVGFSIFAPQTPGCYLVMDQCIIDTFLTYDGLPSYGVFSNCYFNGGGELASATIYGGILSNSAGFRFFHDTVADGDTVLDAFIQVSGSAITLCRINIAFNGFIEIHGAVVFIAPTASSPIIWGVGSIDIHAGGALDLVSGTFASQVFATLTLDGAATGTKYVAGTFTDGVAITPANLDSFGGLQNPKTGARITTG